MLKRIFCLALAVLFALSVAACGGDKENGNKKSSGGSSKLTSGRVSEGGVSSLDVDKELLDTKLAKADYKGQSFVFYYWYEYGDIIDRKIAAFNKAHNAKLKAQVISGNFEENIAKSIAAGSPYDIIANHGMYFPQSIFSDIYEELSGYIEENDYFNAEKPDNGGISKVVNDSFSWKNKLYACGSAKSIYIYLVAYNKLMFQKAGLEDPYQLWKDGKWTWDKLVSMGQQVTDIANDTGFLNYTDLSIWYSVCGLSGITKRGDSYVENLGSQEIITSTQTYANLMFGDNPIIAAKPGGGAMGSGRAYIGFSTTDAYAVNAEAASKSSAYGRDATNYAVVPIPTGLTKNNMYPGHAAQGYSAAKGAKEPSLPCAYALFESRTEDSDVGSTHQVPAEIRNYVEKQFAINGFVGASGLQNSEGKRYRNVIDDVGLKIRAGQDPVSTLASQRSIMSRMISDSVANAY